MARTIRRLAVALACTAGAAGAATPRDAAVLEVENAARGRVLRFPIGAGEAFSVTSHHSMYDAPVSEEFVIDGGRIVLRAVSSPSAAVREYFGITAPGARHAVARAMPEVVFRVAAGAPQRLRVGGVERSFLELGDHGDRLVMRAVPASAAARDVPAARPAASGRPPRAGPPSPAR